MAIKLKYELSKKCEFLGDIFNEYEDYLNLDIQDSLLEINFFKFLEELLADGVIELCDYRENPKKNTNWIAKNTGRRIKKNLA